MSQTALITIVLLVSFVNTTTPQKDISTTALKNVLAETSIPCKEPYALNIQIYPSPTGDVAPVLLCMHGYGGSADDASILRQENCIDYHIVSFNFPDANIRPGKKNPHQTSFGTIQELLPIYTILKRIVVSGGLSTVHLYGFSAGGGAIINFLATLNTDTYDTLLEEHGITKKDKFALLQSIQQGSVILDAPLKSVEEVMALHPMDRNMPIIASRYAKNNLRPIDSIQLLNNMPVTVFLYFEERDEILSNRDDTYFYEQLKTALGTRGSLAYVRGYHGGHNALPHTHLWHTYKKQYKAVKHS